MKITFFGAAREVTGSRHLLEVNGKKILLDCGMFQGNRREAKEKNSDFRFDPKEIDVMILSHAHIDHSGLIPLLVKEGFDGCIHSTFATRDLCGYMLNDSAYIQEREAEYMKKKGKKIIPPLYTQEDAQHAMECFRGENYERTFVVTDGVVASFYDAGHILGSAITHLIIDEKETGKKFTLGYTGDLGRKGLPLLRDPQKLPPTDYLISESTYGNRFHTAITEVENNLCQIVNETIERGGKILIPAFALERTQEIVYFLNILTKEKRIPELPIFVDSPLGGNLTEVFANHPQCFDKHVYKEFLKNRENPFGFGKLKYIFDVEDSKKLNELNGPAIIISSSGMMEHGRIMHHLKNNIEDHRNTILIVGYQAAHTNGRKLIEGEPSIKIFGDDYDVRAEVVVMDAFSAHADRSDLLDYIQQIEGLKKIFLVHGEEGQGLDFEGFLEESGYKDVIVPERGESFEL